ncbi:UNVERIFIED_CONTAM: control of competence regulator ComK (YlbF/YmcA-like) [Acetivibrio alkalicellulosi]
MNYLDSFIRQIKQSPEFCKLKQSKDTISKKPELKSELLKIYQLQTHICSTDISEAERQRKISELNKQMTTLSKIPEVDMYLNNYKKFNEMMMEITKLINNYIFEDLTLK